MLTDFPKICTAGKRMKFATKLIRQYPSHLRYVAKLPWEIKNSNFLQIFSRYGRKCKQIAFWVHRSFCRLSGEATENTFSSVRKTKSVADCGNFWSRTLARFMRAAQFASVSFCAWRLLKHFSHKSRTETTNEYLSPVISHGHSCWSAACPLDSRLNH